MQEHPELSWDDVKLFLAVLRERSLTAAARRLRLDTSTMSRRLARLEARLGAALFSRTRDGAVPTPAAEALAPYAEQMEAAALSFSVEANRTERTVEGLVRITAPPGFLDLFVVPLIDRLTSKHPRLQLELDGRVSLADLTRQQADLALRTVRPAAPELLAKCVVTTESVLAGSPQLIHRLGRIKRLDAAPYVSGSAEVAHLSTAVWLAKHVPPERIVVRSNSFPTQLAAAREGLGLVIVPRPYLSALGLVEAQVPTAVREQLQAMGPDRLWLVTHPALRHVPRVDAVWQFLDEALSDAASKERMG